MIKESYFSGKTVKGAFEYEPGKIMTVVNNSSTIEFINRDKKLVDEQIKMQNISGSNTFACIEPFPNFNMQTCPYVLIRDSKSLNVVNVRTLQLRVILRDCPLEWIMHQGLMDITANASSPQKLTLYNIEIHRNLKKDYHSNIKKYTINTEYLDLCFK
jgi:hypothetical protein